MVGRWQIDAGAPRAGRHYPGTPREFEEWFRSERAAQAYLTAVRFRHGRACPRCDRDLSLSGGKGMCCPVCRRHVSLTASTLMQATKLPIRTWLAACWHITQTKVGMSATAFADMYGLSYTSTWLLFHKVRSAMDQTGREQLAGRIEIDETWVGGREPGGRGKGSARKSVVIVACEYSAAGLGRIRLERAHSSSTLAVQGFIEEHIEPGSILFSDGADTYVTAVNALASQGLIYRLNQTNQAQSTAPASEALPRVHRVISLFKRQQLGTFQGGISAQHLDPYLDEFAFRFNRRKSGSRGLLFWRLVCGLTEPGRPVRYVDLRGSEAAQKKAPHVSTPPRTQRRRRPSRPLTSTTSTSAGRPRGTANPNPSARYCSDPSSATKSP
jgi:transposase-like protein